MQMASKTSSNKDARKRKVLTLEDRFKVVQRHEKGETCISIAKSLGVGKTQIQCIVKDKAIMKERWEAGENSVRKTAKVRKTMHADVDEAVWKWFQDARQRKIPTAGNFIQDKARLISIELGHSDFKASDGWLRCWKERHNVRLQNLSGERGDVDPEVVQDWTKRLPQLCEGYSPEDIFNADESGLFFRALPSRSMTTKGDDGGGIKIHKERFTVLLCASAQGEKLKPLVIGRAAKPRCFQGVEMRELGVDYYFNAKAWMTSTIFSQWLKKWDNKLITNGRKVLLFVDNCPAHPTIKLSNIKVVMLPPNTTSRLQPLDAGIIQAVKLNYRQSLNRHILVGMEEDETANAQTLLKSVTLLDAIMWLKKAWCLLKPKTVVKCFQRCGFLQEEGQQPEEEEGEPQPGCSQDSEAAASEEDVVLPLEEALQLFPYDTPTEETPGTSKSDGQAEEEVEEEEEEEEPEPPPVVSYQQAIQHCKDLTRFFLHHGLKSPDDVLSIQDTIEKALLTRGKKQTVLDEFFKAQ